MDARIRLRTNVSRTKNGFSVEGTVEWEATGLTVQTNGEWDEYTDLLRNHMLDQQSSLIAGLDARFPREGEQQG